MRLPAPGRSGWRLEERTERGVLLLPFVAGALVLVIVPALMTLALAFMYFDGVSPLQWWGLRNFQMFYRDPL